MKTTIAVRSLAWVILAALAVTSSASAQNDGRAEALLQAAQQKQLVDGQLEEAIELYQRVVLDHASDRAAAAQALLEMGRCYEKLGNTEARGAYERLLRDYGDQNEAVARARTRLAALATSEVTGTAQMAARRIWTGSDVHVMGSLSPDGRSLSCVDATTGDLALRDLATGKMRRLTHEGSPPEIKASAISRDGREVAYNWPSKDGYPELRIVGMAGSAPRVLYRGNEAYAWPHDWSPDGKHILVLIYREPGSFEIGTISTLDGSARVLKALDRFPTKIEFSPDGRYIAYDVGQQGTGNRDIVLLAADGSREVRLIEHPADDQLLGWTPDGRQVFFASDRSGTMSAWMVPVSGGLPQGAPYLVKPDMGQMIPIGFTPAGAFYYGLAIGTGDVYTAGLDPATAKILTEPQIATKRYVGWNASPAWSPDGRYLAYISRNRHWLAVQRPEIITIRSLATGEERDLSPNLSFIWGPIRWSPDGRSILVAGKDSTARHALYLLDARTAKATQIDMWQEAIDKPAWFPDGKRLLYRSQQRTAGATTEAILVRELEDGRETELFRPAPGSAIDDLALSPDGRQVAVMLVEKAAQSSVLKVLPVDGGVARELVRAREPETIFGDSLSWSADARFVVFSQGRAAGRGQERKTRVLAVAASGGEPHALGLAMDSVREVSFHPDGRHVAFATSAGNDQVELWVMENFLQAPKTTVAQPR